ncbi:MAG: FAD-binding protein [Candidatus Moduliflexus flocculans]|nr:FAD-binding protein [Candidatus Moduliflexus flocculans]
MHGDIALAEAQGSLEAFFHLVGLGVPFPHDRYGAYVGYKTDHDPRQRATSAGPLTSKLMFEALAAEVRRRRIPIFDGHEVDRRPDGRTGAGEARRRRPAPSTAPRPAAPDRGFVLFNAVNVVVATGGPGGMYAHSVYPESQTGSHGLLFEAGAAAHNLTESQFGLASVEVPLERLRHLPAGRAPLHLDRRRRAAASGSSSTTTSPTWARWPRPSSSRATSGRSTRARSRTAARRSSTSSSTRRPWSRAAASSSISAATPAAADGSRRSSRACSARRPAVYLERSGALTATPIARLRRMNPPAVDLYRSHGIDLAPRAARDRRLRPAQQRRLRRLGLVGVERARPLPRRRGLRHARRHPAGRLGPQRRTGRERPGGPLHRPPARRHGRSPERRLRPAGRGPSSCEKAALAEAMLGREQARRPLARGLPGRDPPADVGLRRRRPAIPPRSGAEKGRARDLWLRARRELRGRLRRGTCPGRSRPSTWP